MSDGEQGRYRFGAEFQDIVKQSVPKKRWTDISWKEKFTWRNGYMITSISSFLLMALFGALAMRIDHSCTIQDPDGRCCTCVHLQNPDAQLHGQQLPRINALNSVLYGVLMIFNSAFGISYVITGVRDENKYLLFCMMATQTLEVCRGLVDVALEPVGLENPAMRATREAIMYAALVVMFASWVCMRPVYKMFGWKIFRRGGAKKSIREMYKTYQRFRALNLLDIQSSAMLFLIFILYFDIVRWNYGWVFIVMSLCDIQASRYMVKYLKRESLGGAIVSGISKLFVVAWWIAVVAMYATCYARYEDSRAITRSWWSMPRVPDLQSVYQTYNGLECLADDTLHDAKTMEVTMLNFGQALIFRIGSLILTTIVCRNFNQGLRDVFYKRHLEEKQGSLIEDGEDDSMQPIGGPSTKDDPAIGEYSDEEPRDEELEWGK